MMVNLDWHFLTGMKIRHCESGAFLMILIVGMCKQDLINLGKIIRDKRELRNLTQIELASKAGVDRNYIGMVERGERNPSYLSLQKIANGLGITVDELIKP